MAGDGFASLPKPPYYAVIFSSQRNAYDDAGYGAMAERMVELAALQPGFLGMESTRGTDGFGITVAYWVSEDAIRAWRQHAEHTAAREQGLRKTERTRLGLLAAIAAALNAGTPRGALNEGFRLTFGPATPLKLNNLTPAAITDGHIDLESPRVCRK